VSRQGARRAGDVAKSPVAIASLAVTLAIAGTGCARRPDLTQAAAPAPQAPALAPAVQPASPALPPLAQPPATAPPAPAPAQTAPVPLPLAAAPAAAAPAEYRPIAGMKTIHFEFDKADVRPGDDTMLQASAAWLIANPRALLLIEGHADERGTSEYNLALGEKRARAAADHLVKLGVQAERIVRVSFGKERPLCVESSESCWASNRRDEFLVKEP
jgi:peptidoglycan-associated lipoprotein